MPPVKKKHKLKLSLKQKRGERVPQMSSPDKRQVTLSDKSRFINLLTYLTQSVK